MLITLVTYFSGDLNAVQAVLEYTDLSTATLNVIITFGSLLFLGALFTAPGVAANRAYPSNVRRGFSAFAVAGLYVSCYVTVGYITFLGVAVGATLYLITAHRSSKGGRLLPFKEWLESGNPPSDTKLFKLHEEARMLSASLVSMSTQNPTGHRIRNRLNGIHAEVNERESAIHAAVRPTLMDAIYKTLVAMVSSNAVLWILQAPPVGPSYQVQFWNGETRVMHVLDKGKDRILIIDVKTRRPEVIPKTLVKESKLCVESRDFWERPLFTNGRVADWTVADARGAAQCRK